MLNNNLILPRPLTALLLLVILASPGFVLAQDAYEPDNNPAEAKIIVINDVTAQQHDLHSAADDDWIKFYALESTNYQVEVTKVGPGIDPQIVLYDTDGTSVLLTSNANGTGGNETLLWYCPEGKEGIYFIKIGHVVSSPYATGTGYDLELIYPSLLTLPGYLSGSIRNGAGYPVSGALIRVLQTDSGAQGSGISLPNGSFIICMEQGSCSLTVKASGHDGASLSASVPGSVNVTLNTWPVAWPDQWETSRGGEVSGNVLANDVDGDGNALSAVLDTNVSHGTLALAPDGFFTYCHDGGNAIVDSFAYHASDGRASSATVKVMIFIQKPVLPFLLLLHDRR